MCDFVMNSEATVVLEEFVANYVYCTAHREGFRRRLLDEGRVHVGALRGEVRGARTGGEAPESTCRRAT